MIETRFVAKYGESTVLVHDTEMVEAEARLAFSLLERWGMVAPVQTVKILQDAQSYDCQSLTSLLKGLLKSLV